MIVSHGENINLKFLTDTHDIDGLLDVGAWITHELALASSFKKLHYSAFRKPCESCVVASVLPNR